MNKTKKIVFTLSAVIVLLFVGYFFMPKTLTKCGSTIPLSCQICKCSMGFPYSTNSIGGNSIQCFVGKIVNCSNTVENILLINNETTKEGVAQKSLINILNLNNQQLSKVPEQIFNQTDLEELNLSNNKLTGSLPAEIRHLQNLKVLDISNNFMTGVPAEIGQLQNLQILNLSNNQLTGLPYELGNLKNLQTLNLSGNNYSKVDLEIIVKKLPASVKITK